MKLLPPLGADDPLVDRVRYDLRTRSLTVAQVEQVTPAMLRITFGGADLADFESKP